MIHNSRRLAFVPLKGTPNPSPMSFHPTRSHASRPTSPPRSSSNVRLKYMPIFEDHTLYTPRFSDSSEPPIPTYSIGSTERLTPSPKQMKPSKKRPALSSPSMSNSLPASASSPPNRSTAPSYIPPSKSTTNASSLSPSLPSLSSLRPLPSTSSSSSSSPSLPALEVVHPLPSKVPPSILISESVRLSADELAQLPADEKVYLVALQSISNPEELARFLNFAKAWVKVGKKVPERTGWVIAGKLPLIDSLKVLRSTRQYEIGRVPSGQVAQVLLRKLLEEIQKPKGIPPPVKSMAILERIYNLWPRSENVSPATSSSVSPPTSFSSDDPSSIEKVTVSFVEDPLSWALLIAAYSLILKQDRYPFKYNFIEREQESNSTSTFGIKENLLSIRNYKLEDRLAALSSIWSAYDVRDEKERSTIKKVVDGFPYLDSNKFESWFDMFKETIEDEGGIWASRHRLENMVLGRARLVKLSKDWTAGTDVNRLTYPCLPPVRPPSSSPPSITHSPQPATTTTPSSPPRLAPLILSFHIPPSSPISPESSNPNAVFRTTLSTTRDLVSDLRSSFVRYPSDPILLLFAFRLAFRVPPSDPDRSTLLSDLLSRVKVPVSWSQVMKLENERTTGTVQRKRRQWTRKVVKEGLDELGGVLKGRSRLWEDLLNS
ncbi:hypothetical protein [Phaffia rhodozyma]|uniref:Uncharacterized protein n=1 Tax=Phaffia rhodozyma TaxID=264483 RepID=A0A0F7SPY9_PHARH|nr:hypothetical protein [Phaffia rhodozyma]